MRIHIQDLPRSGTVVYAVHHTATHAATRTTTHTAAHTATRTATHAGRTTKKGHCSIALHTATLTDAYTHVRTYHQLGGFLHAVHYAATLTATHAGRPTLQCRASCVTIIACQKKKRRTLSHAGNRSKLPHVEKRSVALSFSGMR